MILNNVKNDVIIEEGEGIGSPLVKMNISDDIQSHIIKIVTEYAYNDPLGSIIREGVSNCVDSHTEANQNSPVMVRLLEDNIGNLNLELEDVGLGLDEESFNKYIMGIGQSTKNNNPNLLGGLE